MKTIPHNCGRSTRRQLGTPYPLISLVIVFSLAFQNIRLLAQNQEIPRPPSIKVEVVSGQATTNNIKTRKGVEPVALVTDERGQPVSGVMVVFTLPETGPGGAFTDGSKRAIVYTNSEGKATARGLTPNTTPGKFQIMVNASFHGFTASTTADQTNVLPEGGKGSSKLIAILGYRWRSCRSRGRSGRRRRRLIPGFRPSSCSHSDHHYSRNARFRRSPAMKETLRKPFSMRSRQICSGLSTWLVIAWALAFSPANLEAAPLISSLSPSSATAGGPQFTLTVNGSDFGSLLTTATVRWNGSNRQTTFVNSTELTAIITAADIANAGTAQVTVRIQPLVGGAETSPSVLFNINNPVPVISSLSPTSVLEDGPDLTLTVNGSNFVAGSRVRLNGSNQSTTFVSSTQLTARIQDNDTRQPGALSITVFNPTPGGGTSNALPLTVTSSLTITTNSPLPSAVVGAPYSQTLGAAGGLTPYSWSITTGSLPAGLALASSTGVLSGSPSTSGSFNFTVQVSDAGQPTPLTATKAFSLVVSAGAPVLTSINPSAAAAGGPAFTLTVNGSNFVSNSTVRWNGSDRTTTFVSSSQLTAAIPATDVASPGTVAVTVANPGGSTSNALTFTVTPAALTITTASPLPGGVVGVAYSQTLSATGGQPPYSWAVVAGSLPGLALAPSTGVLSGTPSAADTINFTVEVSDGAQPTPQTTTKIFSLTVTAAAAPVLTSINPSAVPAGGPAFTLTVNGSNFVSNSTVRWNGSDRTTTFVSSSQLTAAIPATDVASPGTATVTVANPGGSTSNALTFTVSPAALTITTASPLPSGVVGVSATRRRSVPQGATALHLVSRGWIASCRTGAGALDGRSQWNSIRCGKHQLYRTGV